MIGFKQEGKFEKTKKFLDQVQNVNNLVKKANIHVIAAQGVEALSKATPVDTGKTAASWSYDIVEKDGKITIEWNNDNVVNGVNIAIILQYGHGTRNGGYVQGRDYINPALQPIFDKMTSDMWEAVVSL